MTLIVAIVGSFPIGGVGVGRRGVGRLGIGRLRIRRTLLLQRRKQRVEPLVALIPVLAVAGQVEAEIDRPLAGVADLQVGLDQLLQRGGAQRVALRGQRLSDTVILYLMVMEVMSSFSCRITQNKFPCI